MNTLPNTKLLKTKSSFRKQKGKKKDLIYLPSAPNGNYSVQHNTYATINMNYQSPPQLLSPPNLVSVGGMTVAPPGISFNSTVPSQKVNNINLEEVDDYNPKLINKNDSQVDFNSYTRNQYQSRTETFDKPILQTEKKQKTYIKKIIRKRNSMMDMSEAPGRNNRFSESMNSIKSVQYDITTINNKKGTVKTQTKIDDYSNEKDNEYTQSQRMLRHASADRTRSIDSLGDHHRNTKTKLLSTFINLTEVESIQSINTNGNDCKIFLQDSHGQKKRKYTIIKKKRHRDGSIESIKNMVYRNYGENFAKMEEKKLGKQLTEISKVSRINQTQIEAQMGSTLTSTNTTAMKNKVVDDLLQKIREKEVRLKLMENNIMVQMQNSKLRKMETQNKREIETKSLRKSMERPKKTDPVSPQLKQELERATSPTIPKKDLMDSPLQKPGLNRKKKAQNLEESKASISDHEQETENDLPIPKSGGGKKDLIKSLVQTNSKKVNNTQQLFCSYFINNQGLKIKLPTYDHTCFINFMNKLLGVSIPEKKLLIMNPLPPQIGQLYFCIKRKKAIIGNASVKFQLFIEKSPSNKYLILNGEKKTFAINGYYQIMLEQFESKDVSRKSEYCLGKLRAVNSEKDKYILYDNGESYDNVKLQFDDVNIRQEYGAFMFRYELCNVGNIRKMKILMPQIKTTKIENDDNTRNKKSIQEKDQESDYIYTIEEIRPTEQRETLFGMYKQNGLKKNMEEKNPTHAMKYRTYIDNPPSWNPKCNSYVYNFKGRVTEASIKNFQLIPEGFKKDSSYGPGGRQDFLLQFGKRANDEFILDVQFPMSIFQAFGLALSAFDAE